MSPFLLPLAMSSSSLPAGPFRRRRILKSAAFAACAWAALSMTLHVTTRFYDHAKLVRLETALRRRATAGDRPLRVLTLGGSVTWGATLSNPEEDSYASRIRKLHPDNVVDNLAIRATGATYPSTCVQSMLRDAGKEDDVMYDVIVLEFSVNGIDGLPLLAKRLRARFPDALIVYVHLYSVAHPGKNHHDLFLERWKNRHDSVVESIEKTKDINGHVYCLPEPTLKEYFPLVLKWFSYDEHHLNRMGHLKVADEIMNIVEANSDAIPKTPRLGSWGAGDRCYNWFMTGTPSDDLNFSGGTLNEFDSKNHKFGYEVEFGSHGMIQFDLPMLPSYQETLASGAGFEGEPVYINYMSKGDPPFYPKTQLAVTPRSSENDPHDIILDPFDTEWSAFHVSLAAEAGLAIPGQKNTVHAIPTEETEYPLRIVSVIMCGACRELGMHDLGHATAGIAGN